MTLVKLPKLLYPERVASATIRGYLTQAHYTVLRWLELAQNEALLCEGDEDIDKFLLDASGTVTVVSQEQIKDLTGRLSARDPAAHESILNFVCSFHAHHSAGRLCDFRFTTTAMLKDQATVAPNDPPGAGAQLLIDVLREWARLSDVSSDQTLDSLRSAIFELAREYGPLPPATTQTTSARKRSEAIAAALSYLDADASRWKAFFLSVSWNTAQEGMEEVQKRIADRLRADARTKDALPELLGPRLVAAVLGVSAKNESADRVLLREDLERLATLTVKQLEDWSSAHPRLSRAALVAVVARVDELEQRVEQLERANDPRRRLDAVSRRTILELRTHSAIRRSTGDVRILRDDATEIVAMCAQGHVVVVGNAGAGKSAVLHDVAVQLQQLEHDVVVLNADELGELEIGCSLDEALATWSGDEPAFVVVDALDAPRDELAAKRAQKALRAVIQRGDRWRVVASSRTFDLGARSSMAELFSGAPHKTRFDPALPLVRHFQVRSLTDQELAQLGAVAPDLAGLVQGAPDALRSLLRVPFNLALAATILEAGAGAAEIATVRTQVELLDRYWARRVGEPANRRYLREELVRGIAAAMVRTRRLRVGVDSASRTDALPELLSANVLVHPQWTDAGRPDEGLLAFSHRVLFDYVVAALYLPSEPKDLLERILEHPDLVLLTRAGLEMHFQRAWAKDPSRAHFWVAELTLVRDAGIREITKVVAPAVAVRSAGTIADFEPLFGGLRAEAADDRVPSENLLHYLVRALFAAPRSQYPLTGGSAGPWSELASELALIGTDSAFDSAWRLLSVICEASAAFTEPQREAAGRAARALFVWSRSRPMSDWLVGLTAEFVCRTFRSDPAASTPLIREMISSEGLRLYGHAVVSRIANAVDEIMAADQDLAREIFVAAFGYRDESRERTAMGGLVMPLTSNRRQDYEGGLYALQRKYPQLLELDLVVATRTIVGVLEAYVDREHECDDSTSRSFAYDGSETRIVSDYSAVWDADPQADEMVMLSTWEEYLVSAFERRDPAASLAVGEVASSKGFGILWRRVLRVATRAPSTAGVALRDLLRALPILTGVDTTELAGHYLTASFALFPAEDRERIERKILSIPDAFADQRDVAEHVRDRLLGCIADPQLLMTPDAQQRLRELQQTESVPPNDPPVRIQRMQPVTEKPHAWLERQGVQTSEPTNLRVLELLDGLKPLEAHPTNVAPPSDVLASAAAALSMLFSAINDAGVHVALRADALDRMASACERIATWSTPSAEVSSLIRRILLDAALSPSPTPRAESASFDEHPSWGHPAARIAAASGLCSLSADDAEVSDEEVLSMIERLSADPEPAVRYQIARRVHLLGADVERQRRIIDSIARNDESRGVLSALVAGLWELPVSEIARTTRTLIDIVGRVRGGPGAKNLRERAISALAAIFMDLDQPDARGFIEAVTDAPDNEDASRLPFCARSRLVRPRADVATADDGVRTRAWSVMTRLVDAALPAFRSFEKTMAAGTKLSDEERERARCVANLLDTVGRELYFASGAFDAKEGNRGERSTRSPQPDVETYYRDASRAIDQLASIGMPALAQHLIELLAHLAPADPGGAFQRIASVVKAAEKSGYQSDGLAVKLLVDVVTKYLAEHRALFRDDDKCRNALLDVLDTFVRAGWPEAQTLTYDLHVIFQ